MKTKIILATLILLVVMLLAVSLVPPPSRAQAKVGQVVNSGQAVSRQVTVRVQGPVRGELRKTPPERLKRPAKPAYLHPRLDAPTDPSVRPEDIRPTNPETEAQVIPEALADISAREPNAPLAPETFTFFRNTALAGAPVVGGRTLVGFTPIEPSGAANGRVVFYTTNNYAAVSGDRGQTFSYIDPVGNFPNNGTNGEVNNGFGGDQIVYYERTRGLTFWLLQYSPDNNTNTHRLAVATTQADVLNNQWFFYDLTPATYGLTTPPAGANGFWLDFPDVSVSDNFLYLTTNVFPRVVASPANGCGACPNSGPCPAACTDSAGNPTCTSNCTTFPGGGRGAIIARIPLNQLAQAQNLNFNVYNDANQTYRPTHGARGTMYWGSHNSNTQIRIYRWAENSANIAFDDVNHAAYNNTPACTTGPVTCACGSMLAASPDGSNFACASDTRILGAYLANGVIGFMWNAAQGGGFNFPHVQWLRFNENNRTLINQVQIFNNNHAFLYPSVHPNDRGHLGGTMAWGGGTFFPNVLAWIADDFNAGAAVPFDNLTFAQGNAGQNRWGDYFSTRVNAPFGNTWSGTGFVVNGAGGVNAEPRYVSFGRERDTPPAARTIYVDRNNNTGFEDGTAARPYNTVNEGHIAATTGDTLIIRAGTYNEAVQFNKGITVRNEGGVVRIQP